MIDDALEYMRKEVRDYLGVPDADVIIGSARKLVEDGNAPGAYISLVNLEEEAALKNQSRVERRQQTLSYIEPPVHLNLYLLFAFAFVTYEASLVHLSKTVELFQAKRWFGPQTQAAANPFPATLEKLVVEMVNLDFEALNNLWGVLGGAYFPSVLYKVRLVKVQRDSVTPAPEITKTKLEVAVS